MKFNIILRDKKEIEIDEEDYWQIQKALIEREAKFIELDKYIISTSYILAIEPSNEPEIIPAKFRLKEGKWEAIDKNYLDKISKRIKKVLKKSAKS